MPDKNKLDALVHHFAHEVGELEFIDHPNGSKLYLHNGLMLNTVETAQRFVQIVANEQYQLIYGKYLRGQITTIDMYERLVLILIKMHNEAYGKELTV